MTSRVLVTARCRARGHRLAELSAWEGSLVVRVLHRGRPWGRARPFARGGSWTGTLDPSLSWTAWCSDGAHIVSGHDLAAAAGLMRCDYPCDRPAAGTKVITLGPGSR